MGPLPYSCPTPWPTPLKNSCKHPCQLSKFMIFLRIVSALPPINKQLFYMLFVSSDLPGIWHMDLIMLSSSYSCYINCLHTKHPQSKQRHKRLIRTCGIPVIAVICSRLCIRGSRRWVYFLPIAVIVIGNRGIEVCLVWFHVIIVDGRRWSGHFFLCWFPIVIVGICYKSSWVFLIWFKVVFIGICYGGVWLPVVVWGICDRSLRLWPGGCGLRTPVVIFWAPVISFWEGNRHKSWLMVSSQVWTQIFLWFSGVL